MHNIGQKIKDVRKKKGLSQEELAESSKINLRTIQRIENNENEPRGKTLNLICKTLELSTEDILDYRMQTDKNYLIYIHLSVLLGLFIPTGNIIFPFMLWVTKKDKIIGLKETGANIINFQITWTFVAFSALILGALLKLLHISFRVFTSKSFPIFIWAILYVVNILLPIIFVILIKKGKTRNFYPNPIKFIK